MKAVCLVLLQLAIPSFSRPQQTRFLPGLQTNSNQGLQNTLAGLGLAGAGGFAASNCIFGRNCNLSFRPSLGASLDADGNLVPQLGITTQVGEGAVAPTFTGGVQLNGNSPNPIGGFVAGGVNNGNSNGIGFGGQTGFGFNQNSNGQIQATSQLGANVQAPQFGGVNFGAQNQPGNIGGVQPTLFNQPLANFFG